MASTVNDIDKLKAFEMTSYRRISESVLKEIGMDRQLVAIVKKRKLQYFGHMIRAQNLCTHIFEGRLWRKRQRKAKETMGRWYKRLDWEDAGRLCDKSTPWYGSRTRPRPHCVRRGPSSSPRKGHSIPPLFSAHLYCGHCCPFQLLLSFCQNTDDVSFSASMTFLPLLVAMRPRQPVGTTSSTGFSISGA